MRSFMREKKIYCGKHYREVDIYPYRIQEAVQVIRDEITSIADTLTSAVEKFITQVEEAVAQAEPKHRRRKRQRERAALIERRYMVQIRHYERAHPFRRVYKPP